MTGISVDFNRVDSSDSLKPAVQQRWSACKLHNACTIIGMSGNFCFKGQGGMESSLQSARTMCSASRLRECSEPKQIGQRYPFGVASRSRGWSGGAGACGVFRTGELRGAWAEMCQLHSSCACVVQRNGLASWQGMAASKECAKNGARVTRLAHGVYFHMLWRLTRIVLLTSAGHQ